MLFKKIAATRTQSETVGDVAKAAYKIQLDTTLCFRDNEREERPLQAGLGETACKTAPEPQVVGQLGQGAGALEVVQQLRFLLAQVVLQALWLQHEKGRARVRAARRRPRQPGGVGGVSPGEAPSPQTLYGTD